jgi:hypothetical protein
MRMLSLLALAGAALASLPARAYRPFDGTDADVAARGELEVELGPVGYLRQGSDANLVVGALVLNVGIFDRVEAVLEGRQQIQLGPRTDGTPLWRLADPGAFLKGILRKGSLQEGEGPSLASEVGVLLPSSEDLGVGASAALIASQRFGTLLLAHLNLEARLTRSHQAGYFTSLIAEGPAIAGVRPVAELSVEAEGGDTATLSALGGLVWKVRDTLSLDAAARVFERGGVGGFELRAGVTFAVGLF